jgi:phenylalanyl-tRNA synthetase beta chain
LAGGKISSEIKDVYPKPVERWTVDIAYADVDRLIGKTIDRNTIKEILTDLDIDVLEENNEGLQVLIPTFKVDVTRDVDVIEEILRIYGYNNVEFSDKIYSSVNLRPNPDLEKLQNMIADYLGSQGLSEIMNNSLTKSGYIDQSGIYSNKNSVFLLNPLSQDLDILRQTLLFGGLEVVAYNLNRQMSNVSLFEFGTVYQIKEKYKPENALNKYLEEKHLMLMTSGIKQSENWNSEKSKLDVFDLKAKVEGIFARLGIDQKQVELQETTNALSQYALGYFYNNKLLAETGSVHKKQLKQFDIKQEVLFAIINWDGLIKSLPKEANQYEPVPKFPAVRRDLAMILDESVKFGDLKKAAFKTERKLLKSVGLFDIYKGDKIPEGKKSYAMSFILQDNEKTLNDKAIDKAMKRIQSEFEQVFNADLR